jgi:sugar phosphate isomerase/epimerase
MWAIGFAFGDKEAKPEHPMTAFDLLRRTQELGLHVTQYGPNLSLAALSDAELDRLLGQARSWDIELEVGTRGLETDHLQRQIHLASRVGSKLVRTIPELGGLPPKLADIPAYLAAILPALEQADVKLGIENGKIPAADLKAILDAVGSPRIGVVLDMANSLAVPEGWKYVTELLAPHTICLHHKEFTVQREWHMMGFRVEGRPAGAGLLDTRWLLDTLDAAGATYNVILEVWPPEQATLTQTVALENQWVEESIAYLRGFIKN